MTSDWARSGPGAPADTPLVFTSKLLDAIVISGALWVCTAIIRPGAWDSRYIMASLLAAMTFFLVAGVSALYRPWRGESLTKQFFRILSLWGQTAFVLFLIAYSVKASEQFSRLVVLSWLIATPFVLSLWRIVASRLFWHFARGSARRRNALVWGSGELGDQVTQAVTNAPWLGLRLTDYIREEEDGETSSPRGQDSESAMTAPEVIELRARQRDFDILYIALPTTERRRIADVIERLSDTTVSVYMVPDYFITSLFHGKWSTLEGIPLISVFETPFWGVDGWFKRAQDIVFSTLILAIIALPMAAIAIAVKLSSPGPILFKQRRYGIEGKEISVWKFRTMRVCEDGGRVPQAKRRDPRVTPLGAFLRRTSLDELPQFLNVLMGDMSIVGPRPHAVAHNELYRKQVAGYMLRHKVKPGITGWAQINGWRGETDDLYKMEKRVEYDLWYIRNWSFGLDVKIILLSVVHGFFSHDAY